MYRKTKKIPTIFAIFLLLSIITTVFAIDKQFINNYTKASGSGKPQNVHFSNISDNSFTLSWLTEESTIGSIDFVADKFKISLLDDLDSDNITRPRNTHSVTIKNLEPDTNYNVTIRGGLKCNNTENCPSFTQKTGMKIPSTLSIPPIKGSLSDEYGKPANTALIYVLAGKSALVSTRVDSAGLWVIPLSNLRTQDLLSRIPLSDDDLIQITARFGLNRTSTSIIDIKTIRQNLSVPPMQIGNTYNFINMISKSGSLTLSQEKTVLGDQDYKHDNKGLSIFFPKEENDTTIDSRPRLRGSGIPGKEINITVNSETQTTKVVVSADGSWNFRPDRNLPPGIHTITIDGLDSSGNKVVISRKFIVLKSGESVLGDATASATLTPTIAPTLLPQPSPTTPQPTIQPSFTPAPTLIPTSFISPTPPRTGNFKSTFFLLSGAFLLLITGAKLLLFP